MRYLFTFIRQEKCKKQKHISLGDVNKSALSYISGGNGGFIQIILEINLAKLLKIINTYNIQSYIWIIYILFMLKKKPFYLSLEDGKLSG